MDYLNKFKEFLNKEAVDNIDDKEAATKFKNLKDKDIDNDGDVDDSDSYLHNKLGVVAKKTEHFDLDKFLQDNGSEGMDEMSSTAGVPGYQTPNAFSKSEEEDENDVAETGDMKKVESQYKKMINQMTGLSESSYRQFKKDPTSTPQQKVNRGINEVNKMLGAMEKIVNNNLRLKTEMGVQSNHFWKSTGSRFAKINERMTRIANRLKELSQ